MGFKSEFSVNIYPEKFALFDRPKGHVAVVPVFNVALFIVIQSSSLLLRIVKRNPGFHCENSSVLSSTNRSGLSSIYLVSQELQESESTSLSYNCVHHSGVISKCRL